MEQKDIDIRKMREDVERSREQKRKKAENSPPKPAGFSWPRPARPSNSFMQERRAPDPRERQLPRGDRDDLDDE